jgi:ribosomal protein S18 acetylase RimI-like enzyme
MTLQWRAFTEPDDAGVLIELMQRMEPWNEEGVGWLHPGDVTWRLYQNLSTTPDSELRIISDGSGTAVALVEVPDPDCFYVHMPQGSAGAAASAAADLAEVMRFAAERVEEELRSIPVGEGEDAPKVIETEVLSVQPCAGEILRDLGFTSVESPNYRLNGQPLGDDLPAPVLQNGATVRHVRADAADLQERVDLHRDVWNPSKFDLAGYQRLRTKPLYRADLDLVVETADGELAAYCIVWWDPVTKTGEFEPVGTAERFRGQGYGKAVLREGMRRLRELGATYATVINSMDEKYAPSRALYPSAGFMPVAMFERYTRPVGVSREG